MKLKFISLLVLLVLLAILTAACASATPAPNTNGVPATPENNLAVPERQDPALAVSSMDQVAIRVTNGTIDAWEPTNAWAPIWWGLFYGLIALIVVALAVSGASDNISNGVIAGAAVGLIVCIFVVLHYHSVMKPELAKNVDVQTTHALKEGIDNARLDKATTYVEELHVNVVKVDRDWKSCEAYTSYRNRYGDGGPSECVQYGVPEWTRDWNRHIEWDTCYREEGSGDNKHQVPYDCNPHDIWNTDHVPYIDRVTRSYASVFLIDHLATPETGLSVSSDPDHPRHYFDANWVVPIDYQNYWKDASNQYNGQINAPVHPQWLTWRDMLAKGVNPQVNVYHIYTNWLLASDSDLVKGITLFLNQYADAGLLPTMNPIYKADPKDDWAVDYDMVQFMGMDVPAGVQTQWENAARDFAEYLSPQRQMSLALVFVPASKIDNIDDYAVSVKANFLDTSGRWDMRLPGIDYPVHRLLPKNAALMVCTVDDAMTTVLECRFTTAMPTGNEKLIYDVALPSTVEMQNVPFSPEGFFGTYSINHSDGSDGFVDVTNFSFYGKPSPMSLLLRDPSQGGIKREKMGGYQYRQANVQLDQADIDKLVAKEVAVQQQLAVKALWYAFYFFAGLIALLISVLVAIFGLNQ